MIFVFSGKINNFYVLVRKLHNFEDVDGMTTITLNKKIKKFKYFSEKNRQFKIFQEYTNHFLYFTNRTIFFL